MVCSSRSQQAPHMRPHLVCWHVASLKSSTHLVSSLAYVSPHSPRGSHWRLFCCWRQLTAARVSAPLPLTGAVHMLGLQLPVCHHCLVCNFLFATTAWSATSCLPPLLGLELPVCHHCFCLFATACTDAAGSWREMTRRLSSAGRACSS